MKTAAQPSPRTRKACIVLLCVTLGAVIAPATARADAKIYQQTLKSTAWVLSKAKDGFMTGTGVLIDRERRLLITNHHVVGEQLEVAVFFPERKDGQLISERKFYFEQFDKLAILSRVVAIDRKRDLAIVQLPRLPDDVVAIEMSQTAVMTGDEVHSLGNPTTTDVLWAYTSGTVRAVYRKHFRTEGGEHEFTVVETQSPINTGDSGGPVVNSEGKLVAISQAMHLNARLVSFCVDRSEVQALLAEDWKPAPVPVTDLMTKAGVKFAKHQLGPYAVEVPVEGAAAQSVFISDGTEFYGKAEVRKIWSLAVVSKSALPADVAIQLLQQNARTKMGAWTIEKNAQGEFLIIFCVRIDAGATAEAVKSAMEYVSKVTLAMNQQLSKTNIASAPSDSQPVAPPAKQEDVKKSGSSDWFGGYQP